MAATALLIFSSELSVIGVVVSNYWIEGIGLIIVPSPESRGRDATTPEPGKLLFGYTPFAIKHSGSLLFLQTNTVPKPRFHRQKPSHD